MTEIRQIFDRLQQLYDRSAAEIAQLCEPESPVTMLLKGIISGEYKDEVSARDGLYGDVKDKLKKHSRFSQTKSRLVSRLIELFIQAPLSAEKFSPFFLNSIRCKKELLVAEMLLWLGLLDAMRIVASRVLAKSREFHMTYASMRALELLCIYYSNLGPRYKYRRYDEQFVESVKLFEVEQKVARLRARIQSEFTVQYNIPDEVVEDFRFERDLLKPVVDKHTSRKIVLDFAYVDSLVNRLQGDFSQALRVYDEALEFVAQNPSLFGKKRIASIYYSCLRLCLISSRYSQAVVYIQKSQKLLKVGSFNWFQHKSTEMLLLLHTKKWEQAADLFKIVVKQEGFYTYEQRVELWTILEGYLRFFDSSGQLLPSNITLHGDSFSIHHIMQEIDKARQDKVGLNIFVLLLQILHYLRIRSFDLLGARIYSLREYSYRHFGELRNKKTHGRTKCLIKMLITIVKCEFDPVRVKSRVEPYLSYLENSKASMGITNKKYIEEIVPYELIWEQVLAELDSIEQDRLINRQYKPHKQ